MTISTDVRYWMGDDPEFCDLCKDPIETDFIDGKVRNHSSWAAMCPDCHTAFGVGLGTGKGQRYHLNHQKRFVKIAG